MRIGPANTANTPNGAIPVPVRGSGWPVSEPPISAISHRLSLLIFSRRQFFSIFLHSRCQNGFDDSSGLIAWCRAGESLQAAFYGYMQAMFRSCFIRKGKVLFPTKPSAPFYSNDEKQILTDLFRVNNADHDRCPTAVWRSSLSIYSLPTFPCLSACFMCIWADMSQSLSNIGTFLRSDGYIDSSIITNRCCEFIIWCCCHLVRVLWVIYVDVPWRYTRPVSIT